MLTRHLLSVPRIRLLVAITGLVWFTGLTLSGCQAVLGLNDYEVDAQPVSAAKSSQTLVCSSHADCLDPKAPSAATFCTSMGRCAPLQSEDCSRLAGPERDPHALLIATMFATSGADSAVELSRQRAVQLAVEEINDGYGIPSKDTRDRRSLLLLACDAGSNRERATAHLASLGARAILGLSDSEQLLQTLRTQLLAANMLTLSTAIASDSINTLLDADLAWLMSLTVEQRTPVLEAVLSALEQHVREERDEPLKLALLVRADSAGRAALTSLRTHELDGASLSMPEQSAGRVRVDRFPDTAADQQALIAAYRGFAPDIVVMSGGLDLLTGFMAPLERSYESDAALRRPHYLLTEDAKGPALIALARELPSLVERVHGVGAATPERSRRAADGFQRRYATRFSADELSTAPQVAAAYDAVYALAYAIAAIETGHELGGRLAQALHALVAPAQATEAAFDVGPDALVMGLRQAASGEPHALLGASGELHWDSYGALRTGALQAWCIAADGGYGSAAWQFDVAARSFSERPGTCDHWLAAPREKGSVTESQQPDASESARAMTGAAMVSQASAGRGAAASMTGAAGAAVERSDGGAAAPIAAGGAGAASAGGAGAAAEEPKLVEKPPSANDKPGSTLKCGELSCQRDKEQCCVAMLRPLMAPAPGDLSCQSRSQPAPAPLVALGLLGAAGSSASMRCEFGAQCVSDADCERGSVCCASAQQARCVAASSSSGSSSNDACSGELSRHLACRSAQECPAGQQCCLYAESATMSFASSACAASCGLADASVRLCVDDAGCAGDPASTSCNPSSVLPVVSACWPKVSL